MRILVQILSLTNLTNLYISRSKNFSNERRKLDYIAASFLAALIFHDFNLELNPNSLILITDQSSTCFKTMSLHL